MKDYRSITGTEFEITSQTRYDSIMMSTPEFLAYYSLLLGFGLNPPPKALIELEEVWEELKEDGMKNGIDKSLKRSNTTELRRKIIKSLPQVKHKGKGRPKKIKYNI